MVDYIYFVSLNKQKKKTSNFYFRLLKKRRYNSRSIAMVFWMSLDHYQRLLFRKECANLFSTTKAA